MTKKRGTNNPKLKKLIESSVPIRIGKEYTSQRKKEVLKVFHESVKKNYVALKGLNIGSKKIRKEKREVEAKNE